MPRFAIGLLSFVLAATVGLSACNGMSGLNPEAAIKVATIDGQVITKGEYDKVYSKYQRIMTAGMPPNPQTADVMKEVLNQITLNQIILNTLVRQEAKDRSIEVKSDEVTSTIDEQTKLVGGAGALRKLLEKQKMSEDEFRDSVKDQLLINKVVEAVAGDKVAVTDADAKTYYDSHPTEFQVPKTIHSSHILVKAIPAEIRNQLQTENKDLKGKELDAKIKEVIAEKKLKAEELLAQVKKDESVFEKLATEQSDDTLAAQQKGDLGYLAERFTAPSFWKATDAAKEGALISNIVESPYGFHIIRVHDKKAAHKQDLAEATQAIKKGLEQEKKQQFVTTWLDKREKEVAIKIEEDFQPKSPEELKAAKEQAQKAAKTEDASKKADAAEPVKADTHQG